MECKSNGALPCKDGAGRVRVNAVARDLFLSCLSVSLMLQARPQLVLDVMKGSAIRSSLLLSRWTAYAAIVEFLIGPTLGGLADAFGRKPCLLVSPTVTAIMRYLVAIWPKPWVIGCEKVFTSALLAAGSITTNATLADISHGTELALSQAKVGICAGLAFVIGPACAGILIKRKGPRSVYALSATLAGLQLLHLHTKFEETLSLEQRRLAPSLANPFSFFKLFNTPSYSLRVLTVVGALQAFCEPKVWSDMNQLYMRVNVGLPAERIGRFFAAFGVAGILAKGWTRQAIKRYGSSFHISLSNLAGTVAFVAWGAVPTSAWTSIVTPLILAPLFLDHRAGIVTQTNDLAVSMGLGKGEHAAMSQNLRALVVSIAPLLFGTVYSWGNQPSVRRPGLGFWMVGSFALAAEMVHQLARRATKAHLLHDSMPKLERTKM